MEYKETYEKFWQQHTPSDFQEYERNRLLPEFFPTQSEVKRVADIAGGSGIVSAWLSNRGYEPYLIEFSDTAVRQARERGVAHIHQVMISGIGSLPFPDNYFDYVFFGDIIEHLFDSESALKEVRRILAPGGRLILSCPNIAYWRFRLYYLFDGDFQRIDVARQKPWEQEHIRFFTVPILKEFLIKLDFNYSRHAGINTIWHSRVLSQYFPHLFAHTIVVEFINNK